MLISYAIREVVRNRHDRRPKRVRPSLDIPVSLLSWEWFMPVRKPGKLREVIADYEKSTVARTRRAYADHQGSTRPHRAMTSWLLTGGTVKETQYRND